MTEGRDHGGRQTIIPASSFSVAVVSAGREPKPGSTLPVCKAADHSLIMFSFAFYILHQLLSPHSASPYGNVSPQPKYPEKIIWTPKLSPPLPHRSPIQGVRRLPASFPLSTLDISCCPRVPRGPVGLRHRHSVPES